MKTKMKSKMIKSLLLIVCSASLVWTNMWADKGSAAGPIADGKGVYIISHEQMVRWGVRNLEDVLARVPGIRMATNSVQSRPASGPLVSSDSQTRLAASHFSRILFLFNGHALNKYWHGGADHEWATGFIEGLKEIRVYTGPAATAAAGGKGAMDMVIDLVPYTGAEQNGSYDIRLSQSLNDDRLDRSMLHFSTGNNWDEDGHYSIFADLTQRGGFDIPGHLGFGHEGSRMERKDPSFQLGAIISKGKFNLMARHLGHKHFDPYYVGRNWSNTFAEAGGTFSLGEKWDLDLTAGFDFHQSTWGAASSSEGEATGNWDKVSETRFQIRAGLKYKSKKTSALLGIDYENFKIDGGPENSGDPYSVMNFSTTRGRAGADLRLMYNVSESWSLRAAMRLEKAQGYEKTYMLPEIGFHYQKDATAFGLNYATGHRYMDTWYRVGSYYGNPDTAFSPMNYIVGVELKPEVNRQVKLYFNREVGEFWVLNVSGFFGKYSHLMGLDWQFSYMNMFNMLMAAEVGNYSYWGGSGSLFYRKKGFSMGANLSYHGVTDSDLTGRQLYVAEDGKQPLFLPPMTANVFLDWTIIRNLSFSARFHLAGGAKNGGIDLYSGAFQVEYDQEPFIDSKAYNTLDVSLRLFNIRKKFEVQLSIHNALDEQVRLPMIEGGTYWSRGREITLTLRRNL